MSSQMELKFCSEVLTELKRGKHLKISEPFLQPIDPQALNIPSYYNFIKKPMDVSTIEKKLIDGQYENAKEFEADIRLMFQNCYKFFFGRSHPVHGKGKEYEKVFEDKWSQKGKWLNDQEQSSLFGKAQTKSGLAPTGAASQATLTTSTSSNVSTHSKASDAAGSKVFNGTELGFDKDAEPRKPDGAAPDGLSADPAVVFGSAAPPLGSDEVLSESVATPRDEPLTSDFANKPSLFSGSYNPRAGNLFTGLFPTHNNTEKVDSATQGANLFKSSAHDICPKKDSPTTSFGGTTSRPTVTFEMTGRGTSGISLFSSTPSNQLSGFGGSPANKAADADACPSTAYTACNLFSEPHSKRKLDESAGVPRKVYKTNVLDIASDRSNTVGNTANASGLFGSTANTGGLFGKMDGSNGNTANTQSPFGKRADAVAPSVTTAKTGGFGGFGLFGNASAVSPQAADNSSAATGAQKRNRFVSDPPTPFRDWFCKRVEYYNTGTLYESVYGEYVEKILHDNIQKANDWLYPINGIRNGMPMPIFKPILPGEARVPIVKIRRQCQTDRLNLWATSRRQWKERLDHLAHWKPSFGSTEEPEHFYEACKNLDVFVDDHLQSLFRELRDITLKAEKEEHEIVNGLRVTQGEDREDKFHHLAGMLRADVSTR